MFSRHIGSALVLFGAGGLCACAAPEETGGSCQGGKCDSFDPSLLEGRGDPIAMFLRDGDLLSPEGFVEGNYTDVLFGVAETMGCSPESIRTFTVSDDLITDREPFPRIVSVACGDDDAQASDFFIAASFEERGENGDPTGDIDLRDVEMFAWDKSELKYRFYAFAPDREGNAELEVDPKRCEGCHLTPSDLDATGMRMTPIMNELNRPWTHWNAEPGFPSHQFNIPDGIEELPNFKSLSIGHRAPAQRFEEIIRFGGHAKVANARARDRRNPPNIDEIMGMFRPLFCAEQINYVSEDHDSGLFFNAALVDPGIRNALLQIRPDDWSFGFVNEQTARIGPPTTSDEPVLQIPVRGNADTAFETQLLATRTLTPHQILRLRALDWKRPVFSDFRCNLWREARERFETSPPDFGTESRNLGVMDDVFEEILALGGAAIATGDPEAIIVVDHIDPTIEGAFTEALAEPAVLEAASCDDDGFCVLDAETFAERVDVFVTGVEADPEAREFLRSERAERICHVLAEVETIDDRFEGGSATRFENRPSLPSVSCP